VDSNSLSGQTAVGTTRDYLRFLTALASISITIAAILAGFAVNIPYSVENRTIKLVQLGAGVTLFIAIFILILLCCRLILHFS
jgi:hypothetical protein